VRVAPSAKLQIGHCDFIFYRAPSRASRGGTEQNGQVARIGGQAKAATGSPVWTLVVSSLWRHRILRLGSGDVGLWESKVELVRDLWFGLQASVAQCAPHWTCGLGGLGWRGRVVLNFMLLGCALPKYSEAERTLVERL